MAKRPEHPSNKAGGRPSKTPSSRTVTAPPLKAAIRRRLEFDEQTLHAELGKLVRSWANLHEFLASILASNLECSAVVSYAMWHSIKSDLAQREMLTAALKAKLAILENDSEKTSQKDEAAKLLSEYIWIINKITEFSHKRNDLIHSPIMFYHDGDDNAEFEAIISDSRANPRADRHKNTELFQFCSYANAFILTALKFMASLGYYSPEHAPLPSRPQWPSVSQFPTRKQRLHQKTKQRPKRPLRPSQA